MGLIVFYICISLYLFGDLAIYGSAVPKSLRDVIWFVNYDSKFELYVFNILVRINQAILLIQHQSMIYAGQVRH